MGLLTAEGKRKAVFNAWKLYARMPVDRNQVEVEGPLEAMASSDDHNAAVLIWNPGSYERRYDVHLRNLPFKKGKVRVYRIDKDHANASPNDIAESTSSADGAPREAADDELIPVATYDLEKPNWSWIDGRIPKYGVMYLEATDESGESDLTPVEVAKVLRINRYFPERGKTNSYAEFDRRTWTVRLGSRDNPNADERIGVLAKDLPDTLEVTMELDGEVQKPGPNSFLGVRIDYRMGTAEQDGSNYAKSVLFRSPHRVADSQNRTNPKPNSHPTTWGLPKQPDDIVTVEDMARFSIPIRKHAPSEWNGTAHLSFYLQGARKGAKAALTVRRNSR